MMSTFCPSYSAQKKCLLQFMKLILQLSNVAGENCVAIIQYQGKIHLNHLCRCHLLHLHIKGVQSVDVLAI